MDRRRTVLFAACICLSSARSTLLKTFQNPLDAVTLPFQRMVVERRYTGRVYVAGVNRVYQLSADLELQNRAETGPLEDSVECSAAGVCGDGARKRWTDNFNKALALHERANKLIACGSARQGTCRLHNVYNVSAVDPPAAEPVVANDKDSSSVVFVAPGPPDPAQNDALYVASTFTDAGNYRDEVPAVATLSLRPESLFKVAQRSINSETQILVERSKRKSYRIEYAFGFASGDFAYFLTRQPISSGGPSPFNSKMVRLCQRDAHYYSYSEVPLECRSSDGVDYNLVQAAYLGKAGYDLARNLSISTEDDVLFAVFAKGEGDLKQVPSKLSALCVYTLKYVEEKFAENIRLCAKGNVMRGLDFFKKDTPCLKTTLDSLCGSEVNYPLGGSLPVVQRPIYISAGARLTAVAATTTHMYTVVFLGTDDGQLKKVIVETLSTAHEYEAVDLENGRSLVIDLQLDISGEFLYALTSGSVTKIKPYDCERFDRCATCLAAQDPYCGWCNSNSRCVVKQPCDANVWLAYKDAQCTEITKVTPDKISIIQAEYLSLEIQNLPSFSGQLSCVFGVGSVKLTTGAQKISGGVVTCTTPQTSLLPPIPSGSYFLPATLSVRIDNGADFAATNFTFFDCGAFGSCGECARAPFSCEWCAQTGTCTHNGREHCAGQHLITGGRTAACPAVVEIDQSESFTPADSVRAISVRGVNLMDFQRDFVCRFEYDTRNQEARAELDGDIISCSAVNLSYAEPMPNVTVKVNILWIDGKTARLLDNPNTIKIIVYKCERLATNCGICLSLSSKFDCGWCADRKICTASQKCDSGDHWLEKSTLCPWPEITKVFPISGPIEGGTRVTIEGANLGRSFADIQNNVRVVYVPCAPIEGLYEASRKIICSTGPSHALKPANGSAVVQIRDEKQFLAVSSQTFQYVDPVITGFSPTSGPQSGGTVVTIEGDHLDAGSNTTASIGGIQCLIIKTSRYKAACRTGLSTSADKLGAITMEFDGRPRLFNRYQFTYAPDPRVSNVSRDRSIASGGLPLEATGARFSLLQHASLFFARNGLRFESPCRILSDVKLRCSTPKIVLPKETAPFPWIDFRLPAKFDYGFAFDGVDAPRNSNQSVEIYPDPQLYEFSSSYTDASNSNANLNDHQNNADNNRRIKYYTDFLVVQGKNLDKVVTIDDVRVYVGSETCNVSTWQNQAMTCKLPAKEPKLAPGQAGALPEVVVVIGDNQLNYSLGYLSYEDPTVAGGALPPQTIAVVAAALLLFLFAVVALLFAYRRKARRQRGQMRRLKDQIDAIELKVASECKEAFAELQTDMTELAADLAQGIPFLGYRDYAMQVLFPGQLNHPVVRDLDVDPRSRAQIDKGLQQFNQLLNNKQFLMLLIRTLESNRYFVSQARVAVGSLLMVILQEKMEYCTDVLKSLLSELIDRTVERRYQPKILFRRSESVAERMLGVWYTFLLYRYIVDCAGQPLFTLYWAIKQQVDKGPQDAVSYEARYSLSEEKLIRQTVDFHALTVFVSNFDNGTETPVRVFDCDTVTQVKEKCLDAVFKTTPYSRRPAPNEVDLEWRTGVSGRLVLQDFNSTTKIEAGNLRKINTLGHYKVPNNASLALVPRHASVYNLSLLTERSDKSSTFSLRRVSSNSPVLARVPAGSVASTCANGAGSLGVRDRGEPGPGRLYHLIKPADQHDAQTERSAAGCQGKLVSEIYLTRLLTTKGTLLKFVEDLFEAIFSTAYRGTSLPVCVKYMFDFMDDQALKHGIQDLEVPHTWKSNSLPLRFWVNLIKNPHFVFDIARPIKIEGCLSVVAQTLMDSCSTQDPQLTKDSPSSKLLFAREIHTYREWVERYYDDVRTTTAISDQDMSAYLNEESRLHAGEFNTTSALFELFKYLKQFGLEQLGDALDSDEVLRRGRLPAKFQQMVRNVQALPDPPPPDRHQFGDPSLLA